MRHHHTNVVDFLGFRTFTPRFVVVGFVLVVVLIIIPRTMVVRIDLLMPLLDLVPDSFTMTKR